MSANAAGRQTESYSIEKRPLITADEILQEMRSDEQIVFVRNAKPIRIGRPMYFRRPEMLARVGAPKFK